MFARVVGAGAGSAAGVRLGAPLKVGRGTARTSSAAHSEPAPVAQLRNNVSSNPQADLAMNRYAAGDDTAFKSLYDALAPRLYRYALRQARETARAEDLVQQAMLHLHCARGRFVVGSSVTSWAFAILRRLYLDQVRRKKLEVLSSDGEVENLHASADTGPEERVSSRQQLELLVDRAMAELTSTQRAAFELVLFGQTSHAEAAAALGVTVASVKLRVQRAHQALREALDTTNSKGLVA